MANNKELVTVLTVKTDESQQTIKGLKKEIADLKKQYDSVVIGSEEFEKVSKELATAQANLKTVMADGKKTTDAIEGSYNHLTATMAELKKEWKATADEVKRNDLAKQIDAINTELKDMDASIGNFQRNVGDYTNSFKDALNQQQQSTENARIGLDGLQKTASGLASGYAAVQGTMALLNIESSAFEQTMIKLQSAMSIAQGVGGMKDLIEGLDILKTSFTNLNILNPTSIIVTIATAVGLLIGNLDKLKQRFANTSKEDKYKRELTELNKELSKTYSKSADDIVVLKQLADGYRKLGDDLNAKKKYVAEFSGELNSMGISMNTVNDADNIFITKTDDYVNALIKRAKAQALQAKAVEEYGKYLETKATLENDLEIAKQNQASGTPDKTFWQNVGEVLITASSVDGGNISTNNEINDAWTDKIADDAVTKIEEKIKAADSKIEEDLTNYFNQAAILNSESNLYLNGGSTATTTSEDTFVRPEKQSGVLEGLSVELQMEEDMFKESRERIFQTTKEYIQKQIEEERKAAKVERQLRKETSLYVISQASQTLGHLSAIFGEETALGKAAAIAQATMDTYVAANSVLAQEKGGLAAKIIGMITVITAGIANVANIIKVQPNKNGNIVNTSSPTAAVTPNINLAESMPIQFTRELLSDTETTNLNQAQKVYVLESDITSTQNKVEVAESNSSF